jgi:hypothetical protein
MPPEKFPPPDDSLRLARIYEAPDDVVDKVGGRPLPAPEPAAPRRTRQVPRSGRVEEMRVDPAVLQLARILASGALNSLVIMQDGSVIIANSAEHAGFMRSSPDFSTFDATGAPTQ